MRKKYLFKLCATLVLAVSFFLPALWRYLLLLPSRTAQFARLEEIGSVLVFAGRPLPDHRSKQLVYIQYKDSDAWGIYLQDLSSMQRILVDLLSTDTWREGVVYEQLRTIGWSPDDAAFAYCRGRQKTLLIYGVASRTNVCRFKLTRPITSGCWCSVACLVCSDGEHLFQFQKHNDNWRDPEVFSLPSVTSNTNAESDEGIRDLQRFSETSVLFKVNGDLRSFDLSSGRCERLWHSETAKLMAYAYSEDVRKLILHCQRNSNNFLVQMDLKAGRDQTEVRERQWLSCDVGHPAFLQMINNGRGHAYLQLSDYTLNSAVVKMEDDSPPLSLPWNNEIKSFEITKENQMFLIGALTNEPVGIWRYDIPTRGLKLIASSAGVPFSYARNQPPVRNVLTNESGRKVIYYQLNPPFTKSPKLPIVFSIMGNMEKGYVWDRYAQAIVNSGWCFVTIDRRNSDCFEWAEDLLTVYDCMAKNGSIDKQRVMLLGVSVGALSVNEVLLRRPNLAEAVAFYSPTQLPAVDRLGHLKVLIDVGELDPFAGTNSEVPRGFRDYAASRGVSTTLFIRRGVGHNCRLLSIEKERIHQLGTFLDDL